MRTTAIRSAMVAALLAAFAMVGTASASAASTTCSASGTIKLSPGLTNEPKVQNVTIKGSLSECAGEESEVTSAKFNAHFKTAEPISCETLTGEGVGAAAEENKIILKWKPKPKGSGNSQGPVSLLITEVPGALLSGRIESGPFEEDAISGSLSQSYTGGPTCGVAPEGKKKAKKVNKGTVTGTVSIS
jgi:hypothetical protein